MNPNMEGTNRKMSQRYFFPSGVRTKPKPKTNPDANLVPRALRASHSEGPGDEVALP